MDKKQKIVVVAGPTASGKSDLAVLLAKKFNGEVISADSRQVYGGMDIGTGKITKKERQGIPHYLLDVASPKRRFTVAQFKKLADKAIKKIARDGKLPIICGGTGFYIQAVIDNLQIPTVKPDLKLRARLEKKSAPQLFSLLEKLDPRRAKNIDRHNPRRLIRALEIILKTGQAVPLIYNSPQPSLKLREGAPPLILRGGWEELNPLATLFIGIKKSPAELTRRIKIRLEKRLSQGMIKEVKNLRQQGVSWKRLEDFGLEYRWLARFLQNKISREEMVERLQKDIEHFAKRQMTWFKRNKRIRWVENYEQAEKLAEKHLKK